MNTFVKAFATVGAALVMAGVVGTTAHAQDETLKVAKPFRVKIGGYFPTDGDAKDIIGKTFLSGGISYDFSKTTATNPAIYNVYADYTSKSRTTGGFKNELGIFGIGAAARFLLAPATEKSGQPYGEIGLGYYSLKSKAGGFSDTKGRFGGKLVAGYQLQVGFFGEVEYDLISKIDDYNPSGFRANIGYRF